ncbi:unnamed protein product [Sphenostylis stenocarpa]|uniref:Uncharacterized protein n=1 Tax=Sphenostylis stenocarpa TaxID=92480 RepID=A0AA86T1S0_9FABA|nr:unnamed protein product [Sphenostylis stenocarpa]
MSPLIDDNSTFMSTSITIFVAGFITGMGPSGVVHLGSSFAVRFTTGEEPSRAAYRDDLVATKETVRVDLQKEEFQTDFDRVMRGD